MPAAPPAVPKSALPERRAAEARGRDAEARVAARLQADGWVVLAQRWRSAAGEIDLIAERAGLLAFVEVKARARLVEAAFALGPRQQARLLAAAEAWIAAHPGHGESGIRFDVVLVDAEGRMRRIADALRAEG
ncbi:MAG TPA: YraN family protein [Roseomonas sp.]|nr:YraN family protein [Roseomonas sp.]